MHHIKLHDKNFKVLINRTKIQNTVLRMAAELNDELKGKSPLFVCILNGAFMFAADLFKNIQVEGASITFFRLSSYVGITTSGKVTKILGFTEDLKDRNVVVVEDIIDTGITIVETIAQIKLYNPKKIYLASLLLKPDACKKDVDIDFLGFEIPDLFVVGYGLDYNNLGRNLPDIYVIDS